MESNNYNGVHILSEAVIMGGISMYFYKEISDLKSTIEDLKGQVTMQNNQIRYLLTSHVPQKSSANWANQQSYVAQQPLTPLHIPTPSKNNNGISQQQKEFFHSRPNNETIQHNYSSEQQQRYLEHKQSKLEQQPPQNMECEGGVCRLRSGEDKMKSNEVPSDKKVVISKISKQIEFDRENINPDQTSKVNTFTDFSPNPLLKSVTPNPSTSVNPLESNEVECTKSTLEKILHVIDDE
jgi:hypothetical protein